MHQHIVCHLPDDVDWNNPIEDKPFFAWLGAHPLTHYHRALERYLGDGTFNSLAGQFTAEQIDVYKYTFRHFWYLRLNK